MRRNFQREPGPFGALAQAVQGRGQQFVHCLRLGAGFAAAAFEPRVGEDVFNQVREPLGFARQHLGVAGAVGDFRRGLEQIGVQAEGGQGRAQFVGHGRDEGCAPFRQGQGARQQQSHRAKGDHERGARAGDGEAGGGPAGGEDGEIVGLKTQRQRGQGARQVLGRVGGFGQQLALGEIAAHQRQQFFGHGGSVQPHALHDLAAARFHAAGEDDVAVFGQRGEGAGGAEGLAVLGHGIRFALEIGIDGFFGGLAQVVGVGDLRLDLRFDAAGGRLLVEGLGLGGRNFGRGGR